MYLLPSPHTLSLYVVGHVTQISTVCYFVWPKVFVRLPNLKSFCKGWRYCKSFVCLFHFMKVLRTLKFFKKGNVTSLV